MNTVLIIKNSYLTISSDNEDLLIGIYNSLTFRDTSSAYCGGKFNKDKIKKVHFAKAVDDVELPTLKIPIGFLPFVQLVLKDYEHSVVDDRPDLNTTKHLDLKIDLKGIQLYDHQTKALKKALSVARGIIKSPTGSGKTEIFLAMLNILKEPSIVLFNRTQLAHQTMERAIKRGLEAGIVQGQNVLEKRVTMATIQSIEKIENIKKYKNLIIDEVHGAGSKQYQDLLKLTHWQRIYGFSATPVNPYKMDLKSARIIANIGPVIFEVKAETLMEKEIIATPHIYMIDIDQPDDIEDFAYREAELVGIVHNEYRNNIIKKLAERHKDEKVLILTKYIKQGEAIQELLPDVPFIHHETPLKDRKVVIDKFEKGHEKILIASRILDEGIDIINFKVLIIASAGAKFTKSIQRLGRGVRATETKKEVLVYDFYDDIYENLRKHSKQRIKDYKKHGFTDIKRIKVSDLDKGEI